MGCPTDPIFEREFAYRTMINYYTLTSIKQKVELPSKAQDIVHKMKELGYDTSPQRYEITLAINSMVGLLIF